jgi:hypothetical protein
MIDRMTPARGRRAVRTLPFALALVSLVAACGAPSDTSADDPGSAAPPAATPAAPDPASSAEPTAESPAPAPAVDAAAFTTADTLCLLDGGLECSLTVGYTYELPADLAAYEVPCSTLTIAAGATESALTCATDVREDLPEPVGPLTAGATVTHGDYTCTVLDAGVACSSTTGAVGTISPSAYSTGA